MDQEKLGGAQRHWRECCLQAGQPVDGRSHFLRGGTQRLRGMGLKGMVPLPQGLTGSGEVDCWGKGWN